jgi:hypothetical protein
MGAFPFGTAFAPCSLRSRTASTANLHPVAQRCTELNMTETSSTAPPRSRSVRRSLVICSVFLGLPLMGACGALAGEKTACDGLVYKESGLTRKVYLPCAGEMMATLDQLASQIENMLDGDENARSEAGASVRKLGSLMKKAGGRDLLEQWDDRALTSLNLDISNAYTHHQACLMVAGQLFGRAPLGDEKYRDAARSECSAYRSSYKEASRAYRYLR